MTIFISSVSSLSFLFLFLPCSFLYYLFYLFSPFLWETTQNDPQGLTCRQTPTQSIWTVIWAASSEKVSSNKICRFRSSCACPNYYPGPSCSKLTMLLVNVSYMAYMLIFLLKKCEQLLHLQKLLTFFSKNTCEFDIVLTRTVNILTTNELVKLMMF